MYYLKGAAAGGICCSITHGALTPVDVVKTRVQLDPVKVCLCVYVEVARPASLETCSKTTVSHWMLDDLLESSLNERFLSSHWCSNHESLGF